MQLGPVRPLHGEPLAAERFQSLSPAPPQPRIRKPTSTQRPEQQGYPAKQVGRLAVHAEPPANPYRPPIFAIRAVLRALVNGHPGSIDCPPFDNTRLAVAVPQAQQSDPTP